MNVLMCLRIGRKSQRKISVSERKLNDISEPDWATRQKMFTNV